jgi:hypothetical protein
VETSVHDRVHLVEQRFRRLLIAQFALVALGAIALAVLGFSISKKATEFRELKASAATAKSDLTTIKDQTRESQAALVKIKAEYATLKANTEKLYAVNVTPANQVYAVKASAKATGRKTSSGKPLYDFSAYVDAPSDVIADIASVTYGFDHPTMRKPVQTETDRSDRFRVGYMGWGCLQEVKVTVKLTDGNVHSFDFDMCKSIGW